MNIRNEEPGDFAALRRLIERAFGQSSEANLVEALRAGQDAAIALVAEDGARLLGHVMFSRMTAPANTLGLAPVSVDPDRQKQGVGAALIEAGLQRARAEGWAAVFVLGEPGYYGRFGFRAETARPFRSPYAGPYFMALELVPGALAGAEPNGEEPGDATYARAFAALG